MPDGVGDGNPTTGDPPSPPTGQALPSTLIFSVDGGSTTGDPVQVPSQLPSACLDLACDLESKGKALGLRKAVGRGFALLKGMPLQEQTHWALFLDQCYKEATPDKITLAFCFLRWRTHALLGTTSAPRKSAKRKAKRRK